MSDIYDDEGWELYGLLREAYSAVTRAIDDDIAMPHLSDAIQDLMLRLARTPGRRLRPTDITRATGSTPSSTTRLLDEAERLGIIERTPDPTDRRVLLAQLTEGGRELTDRWATVALAATTAHVDAHLSPTEAKRLKRSMRRLRDRAQHHLETAHAPPSRSDPSEAATTTGSRDDP